MYPSSSSEENNICSIEGLEKLKAINLAVLQLDYNRIVKVKALRKCDFPSLKKLSLGKNPLIYSR